jgi:hypothetical protein
MFGNWVFSLAQVRDWDMPTLLFPRERNRWTILVIQANSLLGNLHMAGSCSFCCLKMPICFNPLKSKYFPEHCSQTLVPHVLAFPFLTMKTNITDKPPSQETEPIQLINNFPSLQRTQRLSRNSEQHTSGYTLELNNLFKSTDEIINLDYQYFVKYDD